MQTEAVEQEEKRIDEAAAAKHLGVKLWKLRELCRRGEVPHGELGRKRYFYLSQLNQWLRDRVISVKAAGKK